MKTKPIALSILVLSFSMLLFASCKEQKTDSKSESHTQLHASVEYQCPMDCEDGTTYDKEGKCPVCKMDLKAHDGKKTVMTCSEHKDGNCSCQGEQCKCDNCAEHSKTKS